MLLKQHGKGDGRPPSPFVRCSVFVGLILRDGVQIRLYIFGFLGPLGLDSGRLTTPFLKCVSSNFSKKTNNPNPSPIKKIWFGLYWFGAGGGTRTHTESPPADFESATSTIPSHRHTARLLYLILWTNARKICLLRNGGVGLRYILDGADCRTPQNTPLGPVRPGPGGYLCISLRHAHLAYSKPISQFSVRPGRMRVRNTKN